MAAKSKLSRSALIALQDFMRLDEAESLLIVTDEERRDIGVALYEEGKRLCHEAFYLEMSSRGIDGEEPPVQIAEMMESVDVVICPTTKSFTYTEALRSASKQGVRIATMPGITVETMVRCFDPEYHQTFGMTKVIYDRVKNAKEYRITSERGTNINLVREERKVFVGTGIMRNIGETGNLPSGEVFFAPIEEKITGTLVFDQSFSELGVLENPVSIDVVNGFAEKISGFALAKRMSRIMNQFGEKARTVSKFGIGTNERAEICGNLLEDQKVLGTVNFGFGNNILLGGVVDVPVHLEGVILRPNVYIDGDKIIDHGNVLIQ